MTKEDFLKQFFHTLNENKANYFVYGEYSHLPKDTNGSDLDIYISSDDIHIAHQVFNKTIKKEGLKLVSYFSNTQAQFYRFLYSKYDIHWGIQIDLFFKVYHHQNTVYYPIDKIKPFIKQHNDIQVLDISEAYYINFIKEILHTGKAKEKYLEGFISKINIQPERIFQLKDLYGNKFAAIIKNNLSTDALPLQYKKLQKELYHAIHRKDYIKRAQFYIHNLFRLINKKPGYVIAILGTDGSGKSTIINKITPILNESFHNGIIYNHLRPNVLPDIGVVLGKRKKAEEITVVSNPHAEKQSGLIGSLIRWGYYMIDYTVGYLKTVFPIIHTKSKVFIFDRYYYDYYIDPKRFKTSLPHWILKSGECFVPKPDLILCLGGVPEKIYSRKPETSLQEVTRQTNTLKKFCQTHKNAVWIDTCTDIETSTNQAMEAICKMMSKRFSNFKFQ